MIGFFFCLCAGLVAIPLFRVIREPGKIYHYPYFMAMVFGVFILPQAVSLIRFPGAASEQLVQRVLLITCLCLASCLVGYRFSFHIRVPICMSGSIHHGRLFHAGLLFVSCGLGFGFLLSHMEIRTSEFGGWTGPATVCGFFQQLCYPGFAICLMLALRRPTLFVWLATLVGTIVPVQNIIVGRREPAALFLLTIGLTLYFRRRMLPSRWLVITLILGSTFLIPSTGAYRQYQTADDWQAFGQVDVLGHFKEFLNEDPVLELRNAAMLIEATRRSGEYEYGAGYWNHLVFRFVPAQILGHKFKTSLMIHRSGEGLEQELAGMDYSNPRGSTVTAMGDSFQQFGYFGCLFFVISAAFFRGLWRAAIPRDALFAQLLYMETCTSAMRAVTHWTLDFLPGLLYNLAFLAAAMIYARGESPKSDGFGPASEEPRHVLRDLRVSSSSRRNWRNFQPITEGSLPQGFCDDEDQQCAPKPATQKKV
jgi:hypothetical protein